MCHIANLQLIVTGAIFALAARRYRSKDFQTICFRLCIWYHGFDLACFGFWTQHSITDTQVKFLNSGDNGRFTHITQTCKGLFSSNMFFCWGPSGRRPKVRKNASKIRKWPSDLDPSEPKQLFPKKRTFFFTSVRPSVKTVSAADTRRSGRLGVLKPRVYFRISVAMCKYFPLQLIIKSKRRFYIWIDPKLFSPMKF